MLPHSNQFIDVTSEFNTVLFNAAQYVRDLYQTDLGIVLLNKDNIVYLEFMMEIISISKHLRCLKVVIY